MGGAFWRLSKEVCESNLPDVGVFVSQKLEELAEWSKNCTCQRIKDLTS